jgi:hypothetical protein
MNKKIFFGQKFYNPSLKGSVLPLLFYGWSMVAVGQSLAPEELLRRLGPLQVPLGHQVDSTDYYSFSQVFKAGAKQPSRLFRPNVDCNDVEMECYSPVDLNADGQLDVIYSGICDPYDRTFIFLYQNGQMVELTNLPGRVVSVAQHATGAVVDIFYNGCCCDYLNRQIVLKIDQQGNFAKHTIYFHRDTQVVIGQVQEIILSGVMRWQPNWNPAEDLCNDGDSTAVQYPVLANTKVVQLYRQGDWTLVACPQNAHEAWLGWVQVTD